MKVSSDWINGVEAERNRIEEEFWTIVDGDGPPNLSSDMPEAVRQLVGRLKQLDADLRAASGYLMNAKIDLETGCPKATAIKTLQGGISRLNGGRDE